MKPTLTSRIERTELTQKRLMEVIEYDPETGVFKWKKDRPMCRAGSIAGSVKSGKYRRIGIDFSRYYEHRLAWLYVYGEWPTNAIDHINGVWSDNRISNLRDVEPHVNSQNMRRCFSSNKSCGLLGVSWTKSKNRWRSQIMVEGKSHYVGCFETAEEAHSAYLAAKKALHAGCTI